jgi:hypothetical protein
MFSFATSAWRGKNDTGTGANTTDWIAAQNTPWSQAVDVNFRVRFRGGDTGGATGTWTTPQLQYQLNGGGFINVTGSSSVVRATASPNVADNATTSTQLTGGSGGTFVAGSFDEVDGVVGSISLGASGNSEVEFCVQIRSADVGNGDTIELLVLNGGAAPTETNGHPSLTVTGVSTTVEVDAALTVTAGITAEGSTPAPAGAWGSSITTWADAGRTWTGDTAGGGITVEIDAALTVTAAITADAMRFADVDAALGVSAGITAAANLTPSIAAASLGVDAGITATADVIGAVPPVEIDAALGITATPTAAANNTAAAEASLAVTAAPTADAERIAGVEGQFGLTAAVQTAGALTPAAADATLNITAGVSAEADVVGSVTVDATRGITVTVTAAATSTAVAGADLAAAVTITADAAVIHAAGATLEITADASADASAIIPAEATLIITADLVVAAMIPGEFPDPNPMHVVYAEPSRHSAYAESHHGVYAETSHASQEES